MHSLFAESGLLRVAPPRECNTQQVGEIQPNDATSRATGAQPTGLRALAMLALTRNSARNSGATVADSVRNKATGMELDLLRDLRAHLLVMAGADAIARTVVEALDETDLAECRGLSNATLRDWLRLRSLTACMDAGKTPDGYTKAVQCSGCGPVLLWQSCPDRVTACPWCFRRKAGKAIPRPTTTREQRA